MTENEKKYGSGKTKSRDYCPDDKFKLFSENISIRSIEFADHDRNEFLDFKDIPVISEFCSKSGFLHWKDIQAIS